MVMCEKYGQLFFQSTRRAFFAGVSMGGYLMKIYTLMRPERVLKAISRVWRKYTTLHYAMVKQSDVKSAHRKYIG